MMILLRTRAMNYISKIIRKIVQLFFRATRNVVLPSYLCDKTNKNRIIMENLEFKKFDPSKDDAKDISKNPGNYIVVIRDGVDLPGIGKSVKYRLYDGLRVVYTGISADLRKRIKLHLGENKKQEGNAGKSTLRKSIGSLFEYSQIPRDEEPNGKTKFKPEDERKLTDWMKSNLIFYYCENKNYKLDETKLIKELNPPINIEGNKNDLENKDFREKLTELRNREPNKI